jgi:hypothetical protein
MMTLLYQIAYDELREVMSPDVAPRPATFFRLIDREGTVMARPMSAPARSIVPRSRTRNARSRRRRGRWSSLDPGLRLPRPRRFRTLGASGGRADTHRRPGRAALARRPGDRFSARGVAALAARSTSGAAPFG